MHETGEIVRRLQISTLKAQLVLREIERVALNAEIDFPNTSPERRVEATARRDISLIEWGEIMTELSEIHGIHADASSER